MSINNNQKFSLHDMILQITTNNLTHYHNHINLLLSTTFNFNQCLSRQHCTFYSSLIINNSKITKTMNNHILLSLRYFKHIHTSITKARSDKKIYYNSITDVIIHIIYDRFYHNILSKLCILTLILTFKN